MDDANWQHMQGSNTAAAVGVNPSAPAVSDWRAQIKPEGRSRIVNKLMEILKKHLPVKLVSQPYGLSELRKIAARFEERTYGVATSQSDYLRKISLKIVSMETKTQEAPGNAQVIPNQNNPVQASVGSTAQTGHAYPDPSDCQEEGRNHTKKRNGNYEIPQPKKSSRMESITCSNFGRLGHKYTNCDQPLKPSLHMRNNEHEGGIVEGDASSDAQVTTRASEPKYFTSTPTPTYATKTPRDALFAGTTPLNIQTALAPSPASPSPAAIRASARRGAFTSPRITSPTPSSIAPAPEHANGATRRPSRNRRPSGKIIGYLTASNIDNMTVEDMKKM